MRFCKKVIGKIMYYLIGQRLPQAHFCIKSIGIVSKKFRAICGKLILDKCGNNVNIYPKAKFSSKVHLGDNSDIGYNARINGRCFIGDDVIMGPDVVIYTINHKTTDTDIPIKYQGNSSEKPVYIGDGSWICARVIILPGITIGKGCVIGAGAVVNKNIPDYCVAVGNPIHIVKQRKRL